MPRHEVFRALCALAVCATALLASADASAQGADAPYVPPALEPWVPWVLDGHPELECARLDAGFVCAWPGAMTLEVEKTRGAFTLDVWRDTPGWVPLPGGERFWPSEVLADGREAVVARDDGDKPRVRVGSGRHRVTGQLQWDEPPEFVTVPGGFGQVTLSYMGEQVERPRRDDLGRLWVREGADGSTEQPGEADAMRATIFRSVEDGVPLRVRTLLRLNVSGRAREVDLGQILLEGSRPVGVTSALPLRVDATGRATVYARPGSHDVEVVAVAPERALTLSPPAHEGPASYDRDEVWVWRPDERLRAVNPSGLAMVDPTRTTLPESWRGGTTMLAPPGAALTLEVTRRGEPEPAPNQVSLSRTMWLDLDGEGYTIQDQLSGQMRQGWRMNYAGDGVLGRARDNTASEDLLITKDPVTGETGVELRAGEIALEAEVRAEEGHGELAAVGWDHDVQSLSATLHLPPGWTILAARGVDELEGTWVDSWSLFEFFLLLMIAFSMGRLFGWPWGIISALALLVGHEWRADAPYYVWFHLVAGLALLRVAPPERLWVRWPLIAYVAVSFLTFVAIFVPFAREQVRYGLNPQVEQGWRAPMTSTPISSAPERDGWAADDVAAIQEEAEYSDRKMDISMSSGLRGAKGRQRMSSLGSIQQQQVDPNEVVQTGPGLPRWTWRSYDLSWSGPVERTHRLDLWLVSPTWNMALRFASVALFLLMGLVVIAPGRMTRRDGIFDLFAGMKRVLIPGAGALFVSLMFAPEASAEVPSQETLTELERRVVASKTCADPCAVATSLTLQIDDRALLMRAEVHAQGDAGWYLPGPSDVARIIDVEVDGLRTDQLRRAANGMVAVRLTRGRHVVVARAQLPTRDVVTLQLDPATKPRRVALEAKEWSVDGLDPYGRPDDSLQLSRARAVEVEERSPGSGEPEGDASRELPPFYIVERTLLLGLPWQTRTIVRREDDSRPQLLKLPLLEGEAVITEGVRVEQRVALVDFPRGVSEVSYVSELPLQGLGSERDEVTLALTAPKGVPWTETWKLECSRIWACAISGVAPTTTLGESTYEPTWKPWPGESVSITVTKPRATQGQWSTITRVDYKVTPGKRRLLASLSLELRASQGGWREITLPPGAQLQKVTIDGAEKTLRPGEDGKLSVPIRPGSQAIDMSWMQPWDREVIERAPEITLDAPATNVTVTVELGQGRWLLWTLGPSWGPTVLFWSHLVLLFIFAVLLGRLKHLPLRTYHWLLLAIGMSQLPALGMLPLVVWFSLMVWRRDRPPEKWHTFNMYQLALVGASFVMLATLYAAVHANLLFDMDMQVSGAGSSNTSLVWYADRVAGALPTPGVISVPLLVWRVAMLTWALWLVASLIGWLRWGWGIFSKDRVFMRPEPEPSGPRAPGRGGQPTSGGFNALDDQPSPGAAPEPAAPPASAGGAAVAAAAVARTGEDGAPGAAGAPERAAGEEE